MTATTISVDSALSGQAVDGGSWTWAFASDQATPTSWPALLGGVAAALTPSGRLAFEQETPGLDARGAGSARVNNAVVGLGGNLLSGPNYPNPTNTQLYIRLILRAPRTVGTETYFELGQAAQRITIHRSMTLLQLTAQLGLYNETIDIGAFLGDYVLLDVLVDFAGGKFHAFMNGVDFTPSFAGEGGPLTAFAGNATLALLNNIAGTNPAIITELVFAGIQTGGSITIDQHRSDADALAVRADGVSIEGFDGFTWAWAPNRVDRTTPPMVSLPGEPAWGDIQARLFIQGNVVFGLPTGPLRPEGLRRTRIDQAFGPTLVTDSVGRGSPSGFPAVSSDLSARLIFKVASGVAAVQSLLFVEDPTPGILFSVSVNASGDLTVTAPSGYSVTLLAAVSLDFWHLLDVTLVRNSGGVAQIMVWLDGASIAAPPFGSLVSDIPAGAAITFFDSKAHVGAATFSEIVFVGLTIGSDMSTLRHVLDSLALGVHP